MSTSIPVIHVPNMELTPCRVFFTPPGATAEVDLGGTLKNVVVAAKYTKSDIKADQLGTTVLNRKVSGIEVTVTTELAETLNKDLWKIVFPFATQITTSTGAIEFDSNVGDDDLSHAGKLRLHPQSQSDATVTYDHTFFKACANSDSTITFSPTEQQTLKIMWNVLPDTSVTGQPRFYRFGDTTLV